MKRYIRGLFHSTARRYRMARIRLALFLSPLLTKRQLRAVSGVPKLAGAATNEVFRPGYRLELIVTDPAAPTSGAPVRIAKLTGIAMIDEGAGGAGSTATVVDIGPGVYSLSVDDDLGGGIAIGDPVYYHDTESGNPATNLNNNPVAADALFGIALEAVSANATTTIRVMHSVPGVPVDGPLGAQVRAAAVAGQDETGDTTIPVTGMAAGDQILAVFVLTTAAAIATLAQRATADFTAGAGVMNVVANAANNTNNQYLIFWADRT